MTPDDQTNGDEIRLDMFPLNEITKIPLKVGWAFKDSFTGLDLFPFNQLELEDACFVYAPQDEAEYKPWEDGPADKRNECIPLQKGLNFAAWLKLDGFSSLLTLLQELVRFDSTFKFYGPFNPVQEDGYAGTTLSAELSKGNFHIGCDPLTFTLSRPRVVVKVAKSEDGVPGIGLALHADSSLGLDFSVGISATGDRLTFGAEPIRDTQFTLQNMLVGLPGGIGNFQSFLPEELKEIFGPVVEGVGLKHLTLIMQTTTREIRYWEISVGTTRPWDIPNVFTLKNLVLQVGALYLPANSGTLNIVSMYATATVLPEIFSGEFDFAIEIEKATGGKWQVSSIGGQYFGNVILGDIVRAVLKDLKYTVPAELNNISFSDFGVIVHPTEGSYKCYGACLANFPLLDSNLRSSLVINVAYSKQGYHVYLGGVLEISGQSFSLKVDFSGQEGGSGNLKLTASWEALSLDSYLQLEDIVRALGLTPPDIPSDLDLSVKSASFAYDFKDQTLVLKAESLNYGKAVFAACRAQATHKWKFFFGVAIKDISLPRLPLVYEMLPAGQTVKIEKIKLLGASTTLDAKGQKDEIDQINGLIGEDYPIIPDQGMPNAFAISAQLDLGGFLVPLSTGGAGQPVAGQPKQESAKEEGPGAEVAMEASPTPTGTEIAAPLAPASAAGDVTWFNINKSLGPVSFRRVGAKYKGRALWLLLDASLAAAGFQLSVIGLAIHSPLDRFEPGFDLSGLAISYANPPLEITGALMKVPAEGDIKLQLDGMVKVKAQSFNLVAIGSYTQKKSGDTSLFVFAMLNKAIGGPPCFFVTGIAAGIGYNSSMRIPAIEEVKDFPLLTGMDDSSKIGGKNAGPLQVLASLKDWVHPQPGNYWLAAGVSFTSFSIIDSKVLAIIEFGREFQVLVVGSSTIKLPQQGRIYAYAELMLQITIKPAEGLVAARALLTSNSYLLDPACRLTGGFAFFVWFGDNPHAGDFVLTIGGYHPAFNVPDWYPQVPRLGLNWPVSNTVTIKGGVYFALTPSCVMAGGALEVLYHSGNLQAWFIAHANMIIYWKPFYFEANISVRIGVSYRIDAWFIHTTHKVELGASVELWGPPTGGRAHVKWSIISFTVSFGAEKGTGTTTVDWTGFKTMLPQRKIGDQDTSPAHENGKAGVVQDTTDPDLTVIQISVNNGLQQQVDGENGKKRWIVRPDEFTFSIETAVPLTEAPEVNQVNLNLDSHSICRDIGIRPMGIRSITSQQTVTIQKSNESDTKCSGDWSYDECHTRNMPEAMWGHPVAGGPKAEANLIENCLIGLKNIRVKSRKEPSGPPKFVMADAIDCIPIELQGDNDIHQEHLPLSTAVTEPKEGSPTSNGSLSLIEKTLVLPEVEKKRTAVFEALIDLGAGALTNGKLNALAANPAANLKASPMIGRPVASLEAAPKFKVPVTDSRQRRYPRD